MNDRPRKLDDLQRWMQAVITHPEGVERGIAASEAQQSVPVAAGDLDHVVLPSRALSSAERLAIYGDAYYARLLDCLRNFFPALSVALGEDLLNEFAFGYLQRYPPRSYTLNRLADHFVRYLEETRPDAPSLDEDESADTGTVSWPDLMIDLARLEWNIEQVFDGEGVERSEVLSPRDLLAIPADRWAEVRLVPAVCLRLLEFKYPVNDYYTALRRQAVVDLPEPRPTYVALNRRQFVVRRMELTQKQYRLLGLVIEGRPIGQAIETVAASIDDLDQFAIDLQRWFHDWSAAGFFVTVQRPEAPIDRQRHCLDG